MILATYPDFDLGLLDEIFDNTNLTENEKALLQYGFYYRIADLQNARFYLNQFYPENEDESDYKTLRLYDLNIIEFGYESMDGSEMQIVKGIIEKETIHSNYAIALQNNSEEYRDFIWDEIQLPEVLKSETIRHISEDESYLNIYPNPTTDRVIIEIIHNNELPGKLELFDASGSLITEYKVSLVAGGIELNLQNLKQGFYFVTLSDEVSGFIQKGKLVKVND